MKIKTNVKKAKLSLICLIIFTILIIELIEHLFIKIDDAVYAFGQIEEPVEENNEFNYEIIDLIKQNSNKKIITEEIVTEKEELEYITKYKENFDLPEGTIQVIQEGRDGVQEIIIKNIYEDGELIKQENIGTKVTKTAVNKIVQVGTGKSSIMANYNPEIGETICVTPSLLGLKIEPQENSEKIVTIKQNDEVILLEIINDNWYKVKYGNFIGYAEKSCFKYKSINNPVQESVEEKTNETKNENAKTKNELIKNLNKSMDLNKASGLTLEQFVQILSGDSNDKNNIFTENAEYFYYIEEQYNINGIFVAAVAIHESGWGTSKIALNKKNLFGYGAYDSSPYEKAYEFDSYAEGIDLLARVFTKHYINKKGTTIFDGQVASGKYYNGSTLDGINQKYATDPNWANGVYKWMSYLYNKL